MNLIIDDDFHSRSSSKHLLHEMENQFEFFFVPFLTPLFQVLFVLFSSFSQLFSDFRRIDFISQHSNIWNLKLMEFFFFLFFWALKWIIIMGISIMYDTRVSIWNHFSFLKNGSFHMNPGYKEKTFSFTSDDDKRYENEFQFFFVVTINFHLFSSRGKMKHFLKIDDYMDSDK